MKRTEITFLTGTELPLVPLTGPCFSSLKTADKVIVRPYTSDLLSGAITGVSSRPDADLREVLGTGRTVSTVYNDTPYDLDTSVGGVVILKPLQYMLIPPDLSESGTQLLKRCQILDRQLGEIKNLLLQRHDGLKAPFSPSRMTILIRNAHMSNVEFPLTYATLTYKHFEDVTEFERALAAYINTDDVTLLMQKKFLKLFQKTIKHAEGVSLEKTLAILGLIRHVDEYLSACSSFIHSDGNMERGVKDLESYLKRVITTASDVRTAYYILRSAEAITTADTVGTLLLAVMRHLALIAVAL